jgi:hypothetical protein
MITQLDRIKYRVQKTIFDKTSAECFIAGGFITKKLLGEEPNDIDIFFNDRKEIAKFILDMRKAYNFKHSYIGKNMIKGKIFIKDDVFIKIDIVKRLFNSVQDVIDNFDFTICCFGISKDEVVYNPNAPFDLLKKALVINNIPFPSGTLMRLQKYTQRGFTYCKGTARAILERMKDEDVKVGEEFFYEDGQLSFSNLD